MVQGLEKSIFKSTSDKPVLLFLAGWILLNIAQSSLAELHPDEAYYWVYSRFLDWGYFDHPPMVAVFIKLGYVLFSNELGVRLFTVLSQATALFLLWRTARSYGATAGIFCLAASSLLILHVYGFTATPDSALFFFASCFLFVYKKYLEKDTLKWALLLSVVIAGLLYSKYHGVLLIVFTLIANPHVFRRKSFWAIVILSLVIFFPHIWWQITHGYISVRYHLLDRAAAGYHPDNIFTYIPGQLLVAGPLIGWFLYARAWGFKNVSSDAFLRVLKFNAIGIPVFFFVMTFKQDIQPHWTLLAYIPILLLAAISLSGHPPKKWFFTVSGINVSLIVLMRMFIIIPTPLVTKVAPLYAYFGNKKWAEDLQKVTKDDYVAFFDHWQNAARYDFYTRSTKGFAYASYTYRKSQFDYFPVEEKMQQKPVWIMTEVPIRPTSKYMGSERNGYLTFVPCYRSYQKIRIDIDAEKIAAKRASSVPVTLTFTSPETCGYGMSAQDTGRRHSYYRFLSIEGKRDTAFHNDSLFKQLNFAAHQSATVPIQLKLPDTPGRYDLIFSLQTPPLPGAGNSRRIAVTVY